MPPTAKFTVSLLFCKSLNDLIGDWVAMVMTRGLAELSRLGVAMGGEAQTFAGLAGMGDLVTTCLSPFSRNRTVGEQLGRHADLGEAAVDEDTARLPEACSPQQQHAQVRTANTLSAYPTRANGVSRSHSGLPLDIFLYWNI